MRCWAVSITEFSLDPYSVRTIDEAAASVEAHERRRALCDGPVVQYQFELLQVPGGSLAARCHRLYQVDGRGIAMASGAGRNLEASDGASGASDT